MCCDDGHGAPLTHHNIAPTHLSLTPVESPSGSHNGDMNSSSEYTRDYIGVSSTLTRLFALTWPNWRQTEISFR